jgi:Ser/Thr protein kinase RdoA (MazF antagonist)
VLATLHANAKTSADAPEATTKPFEVVRGLLAAVTEPDAISDAIGLWYEGHVRVDEGTSFIHGNLRLDNVLNSSGRVGFIDFENCGRGSFYQDLSRPVAELLLTRALVAFPHARITRCIAAFLKGYAELLPSDETLLWDFVGARIARYYLETRRSRHMPGTVGGIPVLRRRLDELTSHVLARHLTDLIPRSAA